MTDTNELGNMVDNIIDDNSDQARVHFHDYIQSKTQEYVHGELDVEEIDDITDNEQ